MQLRLDAEEQLGGLSWSSEFLIWRIWEDLYIRVECIKVQLRLSFVRFYGIELSNDVRHHRLSDRLYVDASSDRRQPW
jgi:hypothetical protein